MLLFLSGNGFFLLEIKGLDEILSSGDLHLDVLIRNFQEESEDFEEVVALFGEVKVEDENESYVYEGEDWKE